MSKTNDTPTGDTLCSPMATEPSESNVVREPMDDSFQDLDISNATLKPCTPYRAYVRTSPQYIPGQGMTRYRTALKNLIPIRKRAGPRDMLAVDSVGFLSFVSFSWISKYMYKAYKHGLTTDDIPQGSPLDSCDLNAQRLELFWQDEVSRKGRSGASFTHAVWRFVRTRVLLSSLVFTCSIVTGFISPTIFMRKLLEYAESEEDDIMTGVTWACCLTAAEFLRTMFFAWNWALNYRTALRLRSACLAMLYRRVIRLNSLGDKSIGELINIFANDSQRIFDMILFGPMTIGGPIVSVCGVGYILWLLGPWALLGMTTFLIFYPTQYAISRLTGYLRGKAVAVSDRRVKLMTEILNCIKLIKMYAWEKCFSKELLNIRREERDVLQKTAYCQSLSISMAPTIPVISAIVTFLAHVGAGNNLTASQSTANDGKSVLLLEDVNTCIGRSIDKSQAVCIGNGTFSWDTVPSQKNTPIKSLKRNVKCQKQVSDAEKQKLNPTEELGRINVLFNITFNVPKGHLIGVCGHVGSGKSSLLLAALGQMRIVSGQVMRDGSCAFVSQQAWIQNTTLKDNILFGENFNAKRYYDALYSCSLNDDIHMLPGGDQTEIGERGINLSGGQKQRVALARALYANRDIYFLDDPLSAVDAHVGAHIFNKYILTALKHKTVIFVTHQVQYLKHCSEVLVMKEGHIVERGTHDELMAKQHEYAMMVQSEHQGDEASVGRELCAGIKPANSANSLHSALSLSRQRTVSSSSQVSVEELFEKFDAAAGEQLTSAEKVEKGNIKFETYQSYITAAGGYCLTLFVCVCFLLNVGSNAFSSWWLAMWIKAGGGNMTILENNMTMPVQNINENPDLHIYQTVYASTIGVILLSSLFRGLVFTRATLRASNKLHNSLFNKIMHSPMHFFEATPVGRIQNLFSRDMDEVDTRLPITVESILQNIWIVLFAIMFICLVFPWFFIPLIFLAVLYYIISKVFRVAVRDLKRLETVSRSPIFSCVGTTVQGLSTIHAFGKENEFISKFTQMFDENTTCLYLCCTAMRWLAVRIDMLAVSTTCITAFMLVLLKGQVSPALAGLALAYSAHISGVFQYTVRLVSETEMRFISVERINNYLQSLECEGDGKPDTKPPPDWPTRGCLKFQNVSLCYRKGLPKVLANVSFSIEAGEKIGIVGRTGSGKSSLVVALFRLVELSSGKIKIDGCNIADLDLDHLRSKLSVIPQDPVLFAGTIRSNLDPFESHSDANLWWAIEKTKLRDKISSMNGQLSARVGTGGDNLSVGERQLICLARALLRDSKILVLDEATAAVDPETEVAVQMTIQEEFRSCTVLTIAHRLTTVTNCDRILVMNCGQVVEFDTPKNLIADSNSNFSQMLAVAEEALKGGSRREKGEQY